MPFNSISRIRSLPREKGWDVATVLRSWWSLRSACALAAGALAQEPSSKKDLGSPGRSSCADGIGGPSSSARRLPDALKFANGLLRQKKYDLAAEEYERFAKSGAKGRDLDDARFGLANARLYQGNFRESRRAFDEFLKGAPEDPRRLTARYRLGELAYLLGDLPAARRSLEEFSAATSDHPGLEMALTYLGDTCFGLQDFSPGAGGIPAVARGISRGEARRTSEVWPGADSGGAGGPGPGARR